MNRFSADCSRCAGLCCVALGRSRAGGFGADAPDGEPCTNLQPDNLCVIHATLRADGWPACTVFDCFGAGQQTTQVIFGGQTDWRGDAELRADLFATFGVMRHLMEMLRLLDEAKNLATGALMDRAVELFDEVDALVASPAPLVQRADVNALRARVGPLLTEVSTATRQPAPRSRKLKAHAMLLGADLHGQDLSRHDLRGALLIAANLRGCRFNHTDLLGSDLRDADLSGADLAGALFLTTPQVGAARGDASTRLPDHVSRPAWWS